MRDPSVDNSSVPQAFTAGCVACASGVKRADNPHEPHSGLWCGWAKGWWHEFKRLPDPLRAARIAREPDLALPDQEPPP